MPRRTKEKLAQLTASEKKNRENAKAFAEQRRRRRRESCPERLLRLIDEAWPFGDVCDAVSMEIARIRPDREACIAIHKEIRRKMARQIRPLKAEQAERLRNEIGLLEYALSEALDYMEG